MTLYFLLLSLGYGWLDFRHFSILFYFIKGKLLMFNNFETMFKANLFFLDNTPNTDKV